MGFSGGGVSATTAHVHSAGAGQGGVLNLTTTRINVFSPLSLVMALG